MTMNFRKNVEFLRDQIRSMTKNKVLANTNGHTVFC